MTSRQTAKKMGSPLRYFYILKYPDGIFKIGITSHPCFRFQQCRKYYGRTSASGPARNVDILVCVPGSRARKLESFINGFSAGWANYSGDFFKKLPCELIQYLVSIHKIERGECERAISIAKITATDIVPLSETAGKIIQKTKANRYVDYIDAAEILGLKSVGAASLLIKKKKIAPAIPSFYGVNGKSRMLYQRTEIELLANERRTQQTSCQL